MELELGSTIVGAVSIGIVTLPVVLLGRSNRKKGKYFSTMLSEFAAQHDCRIDQREITGNHAIGLDESRIFVFYCTLKKEDVEKQFVDLGKMVETYQRAAETEELGALHIKQEPVLLCYF